MNVERLRSPLTGDRFLQHNVRRKAKIVSRLFQGKDTGQILKGGLQIKAPPLIFRF
jgi:hypothetical protein